MKPLAWIAIAVVCMLLTACSGGSGPSTGTGGSLSTLAISVISLPSGEVYRGYSETISATGGTGSGYTWSVVSGSLPPGLSINATGTPSTLIFGRATATGSYSFTIQVQDSAANSAMQAYTLLILPTTPNATFYSATANGRLLFVCEASGPMTGSGSATVRAELTQCLSDLIPTDAFDVVVFNDGKTGYFESLWGTLQPGTMSNVAAAISWVNGPAFNPLGMAHFSTYAALEDSFASYTNLDRAFLVTYTQPNNASQILNDYSTWATSDPGRTQVVVGAHSAATTWGQQLATLAGGIYVP